MKERNWGIETTDERMDTFILINPTQAEAIRKLGDQYNRTPLTPFVKLLFKKWLAWSR